MTNSKPSAPCSLETAVEVEATRTRLIDLVSGRALAIKSGVALTLESAFRVTPADSRGHALVERLTKAGEKRLLLDGQAVYELAHFRAGQLLETDRAAYVLLLLHDIYVRHDIATDDRSLRLRQMLNSVALPAPLDPVPPVAQNILANHPRRTRRLVMAGPAALLVAIACLAFWAKSDAQSSSTMPIDNVPTKVDIADLESSTKTKPASLPATKQIEPSQEKAVLIPKKDVVFKPAKQAPSMPKTTHDTVPKVSAARAQEVRKQMDILLLEANYDPTKARNDLRQLQTTLPAGSDLERDVGRAATSIP